MSERKLGGHQAECSLCGYCCLRRYHVDGKPVCRDCGKDHEAGRFEDIAARKARRIAQWKRYGYELEEGVDGQ